MSQKNNNGSCQNEEFDLREIARKLWQRKWIIICGALFFSAAGIFHALYLPSFYTASVTLVSTEEDTGGLKGVANQLGGLASLAGLSMGGSASNQAMIAKEILQSRAFLRNFIKRHGLVVDLVALEGWDQASNKFLYDKSKYNPETNELRQTYLSENTISDWELVTKFKKEHLRLSEDRESGMFTLSIRHYSPFEAERLARLLVGDINEHIRTQDISEAERRIDYLQKKIDDTNVFKMEEVLYQLIENETKTVMLANAREEYVFRTIDPAMAPQKPGEPNKLIIIVLWTMTGLIFSVLSVFLINVRSPRE